MSILLPKPKVGPTLLRHPVAICAWLRDNRLIISLSPLYKRFQRKEYANIEIVQTEKKGFGLRAGTDLRK
jgi:hypothetical protein